MMHLRRLSAGFVTLLLAQPAVAKLSKDEFSSQYERAAQSLRAFYGTSTMSGVVTRSVDWPRKAEPIREKCRVYSTDGRIRLDIVKLNGSPDAEDKDTRSAVAAPEASFRVARNAGQNQYVLTELTSDNERFAVILQSQRRYLFAPFIARGGVSIREDLEAPNLQITSIEEQTSNGEVLVRVSYVHETSLNGRPWHVSGWYSFLKNRAWALRSYMQKTRLDANPAASENWGQIEYSGDMNGIPLLKSAHYWMETGGQRLNEVDYQVDEMTPGFVTEEKFKLGAFGINDIRREKQTNYWLYLIVSGVILIAAALVLARLGARRLRA